MSTEWKDRISDDDVSRPKLRVSGLPVDALLDALAEGCSHEKLLHAYPSLSEADLTACLAYAAEAVRKQIIARKIKEGIAAIEAGRFVRDEDLMESLGLAEEDLEE